MSADHEPNCPKALFSDMESCEYACTCKPTRNELAEALAKLAAWDKKYPRSPIYCEHTFKKCEAELTAIVQEAISLLARITPK